MFYYVIQSPDSGVGCRVIHLRVHVNFTLNLKMLRGVARTSLRRGIHTSGTASSAVGHLRYRFAAAAGASVIAASYLGWRLSLESRGIALDADSTRTIVFPCFRTFY